MIDGKPDVGMFLHRGIWLPAGETHLQHHIDLSPPEGGRGTYQLAKLDAAMTFVPPDRRRVAVDVGAHVGLWTRVLAARFARVEAFEPVPWFRACWVRNLAGATNAELHPLAASDGYATLSLTVTADNSGATHVSATGSLDVPAVPLDAFAFLDVDFVKVDCEGWEEPILRGAVETIGRCLPVVIVEQKPGHAERVGLESRGAVVWLMTTFGYRVRRVLSGDFVLTPPALP